MTDLEQHLRRTLNRLIRPALIGAIILTIYGNLAQAQPSIGGYLSHGWAPTLYLVLVEILVRRAVGGGWLWPFVVGSVLLALVAGTVSFTSLTRAATGWGWEPGEAWMFPVIVDLTAVILTIASVSVGARIAALNAEPVRPNTGGRPKQPNSVRSTAERKRAERTEPEPVRPNAPEQPNATVLRVFALCGDDPNDWPGATEYAKRAGMSKGTASIHLRNARTWAEQKSQLTVKAL